MKRFLLLLALTGTFALTAKPARADDSAAPGEGFSASRYEALWTKSPFAVATAEAVEESPDYSLVGIAQVGGVSYATLIERQNQAHFLVSSDKPTRGLTLTSITRGHNGSDTYANLQKDGQPLTLKLEQAPVISTGPLVPGAPPPIVVPMPSVMTPQIIMPGANLPTTGSTRSLIPRMHRPTIHLPPRPDQQQQPQQPVQAHPAPPPPAPQGQSSR